MVLVKLKGPRYIFTTYLNKISYIIIYTTKKLKTLRLSKMQFKINLFPFNNTNLTNLSPNIDVVKM